MLGSAPSMKLKLISRKITVEVFQPMRSQYLNVTDGQTDGQATYSGVTALKFDHNIIL